MLEGWSAGALRYLALCVAAPVTLLFFGFREIGYLSLSAAGIPLLLRGFSVVGRRSTVIAAACVIGLRSALHGFGLLSLAGGALSALVSVGTLPDRLKAGGRLRGLGHSRVARLAGLVSGGTQIAGRAGARRQYRPAPTCHAVRRGQPDCGADSVGVRYPGHRRDRGRRRGPGTAARPAVAKW